MDHSNEHIQNEDSLKNLIRALRLLIDYLRTKWVLIFVFLLIGGTIGFIYASYKKPVYTAILNFAIEDEKASAGGGISGLASQFGFDFGGSAGGAFTGANLVELIKSRTIVEKTFLTAVAVNGKEKTLADFYIEFSELHKVWEKKPELTAISFPVTPTGQPNTRLQDSVLGVFYQHMVNEHLNVYQKDKKGSITNVEVKTGNELFSKLFTETLVQVISEFYVETKSKKSKANLDILVKQADSIRGELNAAISGVATANDNIYNLNPGLNTKRVPSTRRQVDVQANTAILTELVKNLELARVTLRKETPLIQVIDRPILPLLKQKLGRLRSAAVGSFLAGILLIAYLSIRRWFKNMVVR